MNGRQLRNMWRDGRSPALARRRRIAALASAGLVDFTVIALYQLGIVRRLPDLPGRVFDSNYVNASPKAYASGAPDGATGTLLYAAALALAAAGGEPRSRWLDLALGGVALAGSAAAAHYLWDMAVNQRRACPYCLAGAAVNFGMTAIAAPDAVRAARALGTGAARS